MFASAVENAEMERKIHVNSTTICTHICILLTGYFDCESAVLFDNVSGQLTSVVTEVHR